MTLPNETLDIVYQYMFRAWHISLFFYISIYWIMLKTIIKRNAYICYTKYNNIKNNPSYLITISSLLVTSL